MCFDETPQRYPNIFADKLLIYGPDFEFQVCPLKRKEVAIEPQATDELGNEGQQKWGGGKWDLFKWKYSVHLPVRHMETYWVYFPKLI